MSKGNIIGVVNNPTGTSAKGVWDFQEQFNSASSGVWPIAVPATPPVTSYAYDYQGGIAGDTTQEGGAINTDGTRFITISNFTDVFRTYNMNPAYILTSNTQTTRSSSPATSLRGMCMNSTGTRAYVVNVTADNCFQFNLSTPWDFSTSTQPKSSVALTQGTGDPQAVIVSPNGSQLVVLGSNGIHYVWRMNVAYEVDNLTYLGSVDATTAVGGRLYWGRSATRYYSGGSTGVNYIDLATANDFLSARTTTTWPYSGGNANLGLIAVSDDEQYVYYGGGVSRVEYGKRRIA